MAETVKNLPAMRETCLIPRSGRSPGAGNGSPLWYSCLKNSMEMGLVGCSLWGHKELDTTERLMGFPGSSADKESTCNSRDPGSIPGSGSSPGAGTSYPFPYSWASLVAQTVKNPPAMQETRVRSLGWKDPLDEGMATHSSILAWRIPMDGGTWWAMVHGVTKNRTWLSDWA